jgi:hypothetical protein
LYTRQSGSTLDEALSLAGLYAGIKSKNADASRPHGLDDQTGEWIEKGYQVGESGVFGRSPSRLTGRDR